MRTLSGILLGLTLAAPSLWGQEPQAATPPTANAERLNQLLLRWENRMQTVQSLAGDIERKTVDKSFGTTEIFVGYMEQGTGFRYLRPNLAFLELRKQNKPEVFEKYISTGVFLYEYVPQTKTVRVHDLPQTPGQAGNDFLSFLFGMKAEEAKKRYDLRLSKEDQYWIYIDIFPKTDADRAEFQQARLVLSSTTLLPRQLWFRGPGVNGNEITWDIPRIQVNANVARTDFAVPALEKGWTLQRMPARNAAANPVVQPRVVRPND